MNEAEQCKTPAPDASAEDLLAYTRYLMDSGRLVDDPLLKAKQDPAPGATGPFFDEKAPGDKD